MVRYHEWGWTQNQLTQFLIDCQKILFETGYGNLQDRLELKASTRSITFTRQKPGGMLEHTWRMTTICKKEGKKTREICQVEVYMTLAWAGRENARGANWGMLIEVPWASKPQKVIIPNWCPNLPEAP